MRTTFCLLTAILILAPGCGITIYRNVTTVTGTPQSIQYENKLAQTYVDLAIQDVSKRVEHDGVGVPFFYFYESHVVLSPEVHRNRQLKMADVNDDKFISVDEAEAYYRQHRDDFERNRHDEELLINKLQREVQTSNR